IKNPSSWKEDPGLRELFFSGAPVACEDVENDPFTSNDLREYLKAGGTKKFLRIPTLVGGRVKGFIGIRHGERPPYRPEESELARRSLNEARRSVHALRPEALQRDNFWEALKGIVKNTTGGTNLHTRFELRGRLRHLSPIWQENLLHIGQEALTNALKHARP